MKETEDMEIVVTQNNSELFNDREEIISELSQQIAEHLYIRFGYHSISLMKPEIEKVLRDFQIT